MAPNRQMETVPVISPVAQGFYPCIHNRQFFFNVYRKLVVYVEKEFFLCVFLYKTLESLVTQGLSTASAFRRLVRIGDAEKIGNFFTLTAVVAQAYSSPIAETTATKIGVLEQPADDRRCNSGIFSSVARRSFFGQAVWESRKTRWPGCQYANPARSAHPDWRRDVRNQNRNRSLAMNTTSKKIDDHLLRVACANSIVYLVSLIQSPDNAAPSSELISDALLGANLLIKDSCNQLYEVV